jgi:hypothetical protein
MSCSIKNFYYFLLTLWIFIENSTAFICNLNGDFKFNFIQLIKKDSYHFFINLRNIITLIFYEFIVQINISLQKIKMNTV